MGLLNGPRYSDGRKAVFDGYFNNCRLANCLTDVVIVAVDEVSPEQSFCFSTFEAQRRDSQNFFVVDAVMASTAAPTYFQSYQIGDHLFVDGSLQATNPAELALAQAQANTAFRYDQTRIWSLGSGNSLDFPTNSNAKKGVLYWCRNAHDMAMRSAGNVDVSLSRTLGKNYKRWQVWLESSVAIDDYSTETVTLLLEHARQFVEETDDEINQCVEKLTSNCSLY